MSDRQYDNPDDQFNYAIKLLINSYESRSQLYENEIRRLQEEIQTRIHNTNEYNKVLDNLGQEKSNLEENLNKLMNENQYLCELVESLQIANKKLEKFKDSILNSIENNEMTDRIKNNFTNYDSSNRNYLKLNNNMSNNFNVNTSEDKSRNHNQTNYNVGHNKLKGRDNNVKFIKQENTNPNQQNENRIEALLEKLNDSINNKIYSLNGEDKENTETKLNSLNNLANNENNVNDHFEKYKRQINKKMTNNDINKNSYNTNTQKINKSQEEMDRNLFNKYNSNDTNSRGKSSNTPNSSMKNFNTYQNIYIKKENLPGDNNKVDDILLCDNESNSNIHIDKSNQYILSSKFFEICRATLKKEEYHKMIETLKFCNNNKIDKFEAFKRIEIILQNYNNLLSDFKRIFPTGKN